jgi:hypothetical protein
VRIVAHYLLDHPTARGAVGRFRLGKNVISG